MPRDIYYSYDLYEIQADEAIDINLDGIAHTDLLQELSLFSECDILFPKIMTDSTLDIGWLEAYIDYGTLLFELPANYYEGMSIKYNTIGRYYHCRINEERTQIILEKEIEDDIKRYYSFTGPDVLDIDKKNNIITFRAKQSFMTKEGLTQRTFIAKFKPTWPDNYFK